MVSQIWDIQVFLWECNWWSGEYATQFNLNSIFPHLLVPLCINSSVDENVWLSSILTESMNKFVSESMEVSLISTQYFTQSLYKLLMLFGWISISREDTMTAVDESVWFSLILTESMNKIVFESMELGSISTQHFTPYTNKVLSKMCLWGYLNYQPDARFIPTPSRIRVQGNVAVVGYISGSHMVI